jgi:hypothetical protein
MVGSISFHPSLELPPSISNTLTNANFNTSKRNKFINSSGRFISNSSNKTAVVSSQQWIRTDMLSCAGALRVLGQLI